MNDGTRGQAFTGRFDDATTKILPSSLVTHVHLLRHGEVAEFTKRIVRGQMDVALSPRGVAESSALARWLAAHEPRPDVVFTSDLVRCTELATDVARHSGRTPVVDARLREQSMGAWEGKTWAEITAAEPRAVTAYWDDYYEARPTRGESFADLEQRVLAWWSEMLLNHAGKRICVATHIGVIRAIVCHALGSPPNQALRFAPATASHTSISVSEAGAVVAQAGERPWMFEGFDVADIARAPQRLEGPPRIALSGSAGTGKTTLGRRLAQELGVPFLDEIMRRRIESGFDFHGMTHADWRNLMREQWAEQRALEDNSRDGFVADRSSLDYAAFFLHYDLHVGIDAEPWMTQMFAEAQRYDRILLFPWGALPLEDDGVRTTNRWTQLRFQSILEGLVDRFSQARVLRVPATNDFEQRVAFVMRALER